MSFEPGEGTSDLASQRSDTEHSSEEHEWRVPAFIQEEEMDDQIYQTMWIPWPGMPDPQKYNALVDISAQCALVSSGDL